MHNTSSTKNPRRPKQLGSPKSIVRSASRKNKVHTEVLAKSRSFGKDKEVDDVFPIDENESLPSEISSKFSRPSFGGASVGGSIIQSTSSRKTRAAKARASLMPSIRNTLNMRNRKKTSCATEVTPWSRKDWFRAERTSFLQQREGVSKGELCEVSLYRRLQNIEFETEGGREYIDEAELEMLLLMIREERYQEIQLSRNIFYVVLEECYNMDIDLHDEKIKYTLRVLFDLLSDDNTGHFRLKDLVTFVQFLWENSEDFQPRVVVKKYMQMRKTKSKTDKDSVISSSSKLHSVIQSNRTLAKRSPSGKRAFSQLKRTLKGEGLKNLRASKSNSSLAFRLFDLAHVGNLSKDAFESMVYILLKNDLTTFMEVVPSGEESFMEFLKSEQNHESLLFFKWIKERTQGSKDSFDVFIPTIDAATAAECFLRTSADMCINISADTRNQALSDLQKNQTSKKSLIKLSFLQKAYEEVFDLMENDSFHRYRAKLRSNDSHETHILADVVWESLGLLSHDSMAPSAFEIWASKASPLFDVLSDVKSFCSQMVSIEK